MSGMEWIVVGLVTWVKCKIYSAGNLFFFPLQHSFHSWLGGTSECLTNLLMCFNFMSVLIFSTVDQLQKNWMVLGPLWYASPFLDGKGIKQVQRRSTDILQLNSRRNIQPIFQQTLHLNRVLNNYGDILKHFNRAFSQKKKKNYLPKVT